MEPYIILEIANTHAGDIAYVYKLLEEYKDYKKNAGIKFQPFKYDEIAREDYEWYKIYQTLFFDEPTWKAIIHKSSETKEVWIDVSNKYSVTILENNLERIKGIKFQSSILDNVQLLRDLQKIDFSAKTVIINVAAITLEKIREHIKEIKNLLNPGEIVLQIGFQDYPTTLPDSGLSKIDVLKKEFRLPLSFADHIDGTHEDAVNLPFAASLKGVKIIEKHVMCSGEKAKYDHFSSVTPEVFERIYTKINEYVNLLQQPFINEKEMAYLTKTAMKPTICRDLKNGQIVSLLDDVNYKRTNEDGLDICAIKELNKSFHVLAADKKDGEVFTVNDFKKAKIASIIAGRLKSSRLPKKAILKVGDISSIELCIKNSLRFKETEHTILATSTAEEDMELKDYTYSPEVIFHRGHPEDVIERYLAIINKLDIDVFIRITADMPYVSDEIVTYLLQSHFETGADYTAPKKAAIGQGVQIINASALRKVRTYFPVSDFSEYMNAYIIYNPTLFKINEIDLPDELIRNYRLTIDYPEDLEFVKQVEQYFKKSEKEYNIANLFQFLDTNPDVVAINKEKSLIYKVNAELIEKIKQKTTFIA